MDTDCTKQCRFTESVWILITMQSINFNEFLLNFLWLCVLFSIVWVFHVILHSQILLYQNICCLMDWNWETVQPVKILSVLCRRDDFAQPYPTCGTMSFRYSGQLCLIVYIFRSLFVALRVSAFILCRSIYCNKCRHNLSYFFLGIGPYVNDKC